MKRNLFYICTLICTTCIIMSCNNKPQPSPNVPSQEKQDTIASDSTVYGTCGESTAMHTLELIKDNGDTLTYLMDADQETDMQGGLLVGDRVAVLGYLNADKEYIATKVINLTTLLGVWGSIDKKIEFLEGGKINSFVSSESHTWTSWHIRNGKLFLDQDSFNIYRLGADSLYLENEKGIFGYKRILK